MEPNDIEHQPCQNCGAFVKVNVWDDYYVGEYVICRSCRQKGVTGITIDKMFDESPLRASYVDVCMTQQNTHGQATDRPQLQIWEREDIVRKFYENGVDKLGRRWYNG